jgi:hypothetical protein
MRYKRAVFAAGIAVGFIAGSRAGRKPYDAMVRSARKAMQSPPAQRAFKAATDKGTAMKESATAKAGDLAKSAFARVSKAVGSGARKARDSARADRHHVGHMGTPTVDAPSMNGNGHTTAHDYLD